MDLDTTNGRSLSCIYYYAHWVVNICNKDFLMHPQTSQFIRSLFLLLLTSTFLAACTSEETADAGGGTGIPAAVEMGDVTLLITDAPNSEYEEVNVTAESVSLVGEGPEAQLMNRSQRFNLLDLRNTFRKLSRCKAPVGTYSKVRFRIRDVEVVKYKANGLVERAYPRLQSNQMDLNARTQFAVDRLRQLIVKLDLDADASLGTDPDAVDTDNPDGTVFDPNATVDVDSVPADTTEPPQDVTPLLMKEQGTIQSLTADAFQVCVPDPNVAGQCEQVVQVSMGTDTVVWNTQIQAGGSETLNGTASVIVIGHLDVTTDTVNALHVIQQGTRVSGYAGNFNADGSFTVTAGAYAGSSFTVSLADPSLGIYDEAGNVLDASALGANVEAEVIGLLTPGLPPLQPSTITPAVIIVSTATTP